MSERSPGWIWAGTMALASLPACGMAGDMALRWELKRARYTEIKASGDVVCGWFEESEEDDDEGSLHCYSPISRGAHDGPRDSGYSFEETTKGAGVVRRHGYSVWWPFGRDYAPPYLQQGFDLYNGRICAIREGDLRAQCSGIAEPESIPDLPFGRVHVGAAFACGVLMPDTYEPGGLDCWNGNIRPPEELDYLDDVSGYLAELPIREGVACGVDNDVFGCWRYTTASSVGVLVSVALPGSVEPDHFIVLDFADHGVVFCLPTAGMPRDDSTVIDPGLVCLDLKEEAEGEWELVPVVGWYPVPYLVAADLHELDFASWHDDRLDEGAVYSKLAKGSDHFCALDTDGLIHCYGMRDGGPSDYYQVRNTPCTGADSSELDCDKRFKDVAAGDGFSCGIRAACGSNDSGGHCGPDVEGKLECWGRLEISPD